MGLVRPRLCRVSQHLPSFFGLGRGKPEAERHLPRPQLLSAGFVAGGGSSKTPSQCASSLKQVVWAMRLVRAARICA